jgi:CheY-like chemotaxis protein
MIRVFRVVPGESFNRARERPADLEAPDLPELVRRIQKNREPWTKSEVDAVRQATTTLDNDTSADVLVSWGGGIFRVERSWRETPAAPPRPAPKTPPVSWTASERSGLILVVDDDKHVATRTRHLLRFIGYSTESATPGVSPHENGGRLVDEILAKHPELVILGEQAWLRAGAELARGCRAGDPIGVAAMIRRDGSAGTLPQGLDAVLDVPLRVEAIASILDPILARVREAKTGATTPRGS